MHVLFTCSNSCLLLISTVFSVSIFIEGSVDDSPRFAEKLNNVTVVKGRNAELTCLIENLGDHKVAWVKVDTQTILTIGNHLITRNYRISLSSADQRVWRLRISEARRRDEGWYMCQINTNPMQLQAALLQVVEPPDIVTDQSTDDLLATEGQPVILRCVARGHPKPTIVWRRENYPPLRSDPKSGIIVNGSDVYIDRVHRHHMGVYFCVASNNVPPSVSKRMVLQVQFAPQLNFTSKTVHALSLQSTVLQCNVEAFPNPVTYWVRNSRHVMTSGERFQLQEIISEYRVVMTLTITAVVNSDFTTYSCVAKNPLGEVKGSIFLLDRSLRQKKKKFQKKKQRRPGIKSRKRPSIDNDISMDPSSGTLGNLPTEYTDVLSRNGWNVQDSIERDERDEETNQEPDTAVQAGVNPGLLHFLALLYIAMLCL